MSTVVSPTYGRLVPSRIGSIDVSPMRYRRKNADTYPVAMIW
jgi:hypothetical protein